MSVKCTRCDGTGFVNADQIPEDVLAKGHEAVREWIDELAAKRIRNPCYCHTSPPCHSCIEYVTDVAVCDCCGDGEEWHGTPGEHYGPDDPQGPRGPYANNGGLCPCH